MGFHGHGPVATLLPVDPVFYEINTTASTSGIHSVCLSYDPGQVMPGAALHLMHYTGGAWSDITTSTNYAGSVICGATASFSPFAVMQSQSSNPVGGVSELSVAPSHGGTGPTAWLLVLGAASLALACTAGAWYTRRRFARRH